MNKLKKIIGTCSRGILLLVISLLFGSALYSWNAETLVGNAMPMPFGIGASVVLSGSMETEYSVDDLVIVKRSDEYQIGDVVVYQSEHSLILHRIIAMEGDEVITKGDANNIEDEPIRKEYIKGRAIAKIPKAGGLVHFLKTPVGFLLVLILAIVLLELPYYRERRKVMDEQEKIKEEIRKIKNQ